MIITGIRAVAIYDPSDGTTVQIEQVIAGSFEFSKREYDTGERTSTGSMRRTSDLSECRFRFLRTDDETYKYIKTLEGWEGQTRISLVAYGESVCVQWYETDHFTLRRVPLPGQAQRGDVYEFEMVREGHGRHSIWQQANLLGHINGYGVTSWQEDPDTADIADGYTSTGAGTLAWNDLVNGQDVTHNAADHGIYVDIVFPLQVLGYTFTLTSYIVDAHTDTSTATVRLEGKNFAGATIDSAETDSAASTRASCTLDVFLTLYTIRVMPILTPTGVTTSDTVTANYPVLRVDGGTDFIDKG